MVTEEQLWDKITESAKRKFDFDSLLAKFPFEGKSRIVIADNMLWKIIHYLAFGKSAKVLGMEFFNEFVMLGIHWKQEDIDVFLSDKKTLFAKEIFATKTITQLLNEGVEPAILFNTLQQLL